MEQLLRQRAESIWTAAIRSVLPDEAVRRALEHFHPQGRVFLVAAGKAAWQMAHAALAVLGCVDAGIVITKYGHVRGPLPGVTCCKAGHPVPDDNSFAATQRALALVSGLRADDTVLFLLSGGGSALFEKPLLPAEELQAITQALLACGADIVEINTIRKRLSAVKGGRFALACAPAAVYSVVLSDILGDPLDMIASGPACPDSSTCAQAAAIAEKYRLTLSPAAAALLRQETRELTVMPNESREKALVTALLDGPQQKQWHKAQKKKQKQTCLQSRNILLNRIGMVYLVTACGSLISMARPF